MYAPHLFRKSEASAVDTRAEHVMMSADMLKLCSSVLLLCISNTFMTFAWYGFLRKPGEAASHAWWKLVLLSWGVAFFEYCFMVPANHLGRSAGLSLAQLKIMQEAISLTIFVPFMLFYMGEQWKWDYLWAFFCVLGAIYFVNRQALFIS